MGKYNKIGLHLANEPSNKVQFTFEEIENILGFSLPKSAKKYRPWWANDKTHVQASDGWIDHGWGVVYIDMDKQIVEFNKVKRYKRRTVYESENYKKHITPQKFENIVRNKMSRYYDKVLFPGEILGVHKLFDMISENKKVVGDAKYMTMIRGKYLPPAKFSIIAEHVWLLEKCNAKKKFLVFGNDRRVPKEWLKRYGELVTDIDFFFYDTENKKLLKLN